MKIITAQDLHVNRLTLHIKYFRKKTSPNFQAQAVSNINAFKSNPWPSLSNWSPCMSMAIGYAYQKRESTCAWSIGTPHSFNVFFIFYSNKSLTKFYSPTIFFHLGSPNKLLSLSTSLSLNIYYCIWFTCMSISIQDLSKTISQTPCIPLHFFFKHLQALIQAIC